MRLPKDVKPIKYYIKLDVDINNLEYRGEENIEIDINKPTNKIYLHSKDIKIELIKLDNKKVSFRNIDNETIEINLYNKYYGKKKLYIKFRGKVRNDLIGFYLSKGKDKILTTQFEPTYARYFIPCFDEPEFKAEFELKVKVDKDYDVISNTEIENEETNEDYKIVKFKKTPPMSTYLLYLGIGKFDYLEDKYENKKIRIVTDIGKAEDGENSLDWAKKVLKYYENYSSIEYPLKKLDLIAIPDFAAGAMENWGAITFRESALLYKEDYYSYGQRLRIYGVIAHELWHQWSGNLVTMKWWDDLWLNESFATYMEYKAMDELLNEDNIGSNYMYTVDTYGAKFEDSTIYTHPINVKVEKEEEIESIFDSISYGKGGNILRMVDNYLGYDKFRVAIINYLHKYKYSNASSSDLFKEFELIGGKYVREMIEKFVNSPGYPIINVHYNNLVIHLSQSRFLYNKKENKKWTIPLFLDIEGEKMNILFNKSKGKIILKRDPRYFIINRDAIGFYVSNYENLEYIGNAIKEKKISPLSRAVILHDYYLLALMNKIKLKKLFELIEYYRNEDNWLVLSILYTILNDISFYFNIEEKKIFEHYIDIFKNYYNIEIKDYNSLMLKRFAYRTLGFLNDYNIIKDSFNKFKEWEKLNNNDRQVISDIIGLHGGTNEYMKMYNLYSKSQNPEERIILLRGLSNFRRTSIIVDLLDKAIDNYIKLQDWRTLFTNISKNPEVVYVLYQWFKDNISEIKKYENAYLVIRDVIRSLFEAYTGNIVKDIKQFMIKNLPKYKNDIIKFSHYSEIYTNFVSKNKEDIEDLL